MMLFLLVSDLKNLILVIMLLNSTYYHLYITDNSYGLWLVYLKEIYGNRYDFSLIADICTQQLDTEEHVKIWAHIHRTWQNVK